MPAATHVLLVSRDTLRIYPAQGVAAGDRTTVRKFSPPEEVPMLAAAALDTPQGPGIVFLTKGLWHVVSFATLSPHHSGAWLALCKKSA